MPTQLILQVADELSLLETIHHLHQTFPIFEGDSLSSCDLVARTMTYTLTLPALTPEQVGWVQYQENEKRIVAHRLRPNTTHILYDGEEENDRLVALLGHAYDKQLVDLTAEISLAYGVSLTQRYSDHESESLLLGHQQMHNLIETYKHWLLQHPDPQNEQEDFSDHPF